MQNNQGSEEVTRQLAGISQILHSIAEEATAEVRNRIAEATTILSGLTCPPGRTCIQQTPDVEDSLAMLTPIETLPTPSTAVTKEFKLSDFSNVEIDCPFVFEIAAGNSFRVAITASEELFDYVKVCTSGDTLKLSLKPVRFTTLPILHARIVMPSLNRLRQGAASKGIATGFNSHDTLDLYLSGASALDMSCQAGDARIEVSGASRISGDLNARNVDLVLSGASRAALKGLCNSLSLSAWGAVDVELSNFTAEDGIVYLKGASQAAVCVSGCLDVDLTGASRLKYLGTPEIREVNLSGASLLGRI
jgi:hypothetical protein